MSMKGGDFGNCLPLKPHKARKPAESFKTPGPGQYPMQEPMKTSTGDLEREGYRTAAWTAATSGQITKYRGSPKPLFGGPLCKIDKAKTGYLREALTFKAPGPGAYTSTPTLGSQPNSRKPTASRTKFGTSPKFGAPTQRLM